MTEEDDVMSNHVVVCSCERVNVGGGELGTGQSHYCLSTACTV